MRTHFTSSPWDIRTKPRRIRSCVGENEAARRLPRLLLEQLLWREAGVEHIDLIQPAGRNPLRTPRSLETIDLTFNPQTKRRRANATVVNKGADTTLGFHFQSAEPLLRARLGRLVFAARMISSDHGALGLREKKQMSTAPARMAFTITLTRREELNTIDLLCDVSHSLMFGFWDVAGDL